MWLATDSRLKRRVAIKALSGRDSSSGSVERFAREAQMTARVNHPSIVTVHDVGRHEGRRYIVMEYVDGPDLAQVIASGAVRIPWAARIAVQVADALLAGHRVGVVHRDIKPGNILIDQHLDLAKLTDFGLVKLASSFESITPTGSLMGTPLYASPEQMSGQNTTKESDVFALGATLYHLFTGAPPREGGNLPQFVAQIRSRPAAAADRRPDVPRPISDALDQMLDPDSQRRVGALERLIDVARRFASGFDTPAEGTLEERAIEHPVARPEPPAPNLTVVASQPSAGFFDATVFPKTEFFRDDDDRFAKIQETLQFYRNHLNSEYETLLRQATLTYRLWLACVALGFAILLAGVGAMLSGRISEGAATAASTIVVFFIQRVFQQREDHYRSLARAKNAHLEYRQPMAARDPDHRLDSQPAGARRPASTPGGGADREAGDHPTGLKRAR